MPRLRHLLAPLVAIAGLLVAGVARERRRTTQRVAELRSHAVRRGARTVDADDFEDLPAPVRRYFENVLPDGQPFVDEVRLEQAGTLRLGEHGSPWKSFAATQWVTTNPPGFLWRAAIRLLPLVRVSIIDVYRGGDGDARVSLFGLPLGGADASPELNEAELMRYLAEAVWCPTALLPSEGVEWEAVDDDAARATLEREGTEASLVFHFAHGEVTRVHTEARYRQVDGELVPTPWTGRWRDYQRRNGILVPTAGEVVWHLSDGDLTAWRGRVTDIDHRPA